MTSTNITVDAKLIGVQENCNGRPYRYSFFDEELGKYVLKLSTTKPTKCLFLTKDRSLKWIAVNAGVFRGRWFDEDKDKSQLVFPCFPTGAWNVGQIRRCEDGAIRVVETSEKPLVGIKNVWHPTRIEFTEFELLRQVGKLKGRLWHAKHHLFQEQRLFVKVEPWANNWSLISMENETEVYQRIEGLKLAPRFLGHVTCQGAVIGYVIEYLEEAKTTTSKDMEDRLKAIEKLHALNITHGTAHRENFLRVGTEILMIDFQESRFDDKATNLRKGFDIRRIKNFEDDSWVGSDEDDELELAQWQDNEQFFDDFIDDEINWSDDPSESEEDPSEIDPSERVDRDPESEDE